MTRKTLNLTDELYDYLLSVSVKETEVLRELREMTEKRSDALFQISPDHGQLMAVLVKLIQAKRILEIGTYTGYSALFMAQSLPENGEIITCDINESTSEIARSYWKKAGMDEKIRLVLGPAEETLQQLLRDNHEETFDFAFIDAEKTKYITYYNLAFDLVRPGGLITIDNVLWYGKPADRTNKEDDTVAIRKFNEYIRNDTRVTSCIVPFADGLTLVVKN